MNRFLQIGFQICLFSLSSKGFCNWLPTTFVSPAGTAANNPFVDMDKNGNAYISWIFGSNSLQVGKYNKAILYGSIQTLSSGSTYLSPRVACDGLGNAFVVWTSPSFGSTLIQASRYDTTLDVWQNAPSPLSLVSGTQAAVSADDQGNALVCWSLTSNGQIQNARYDAASSSWVNTQGSALSLFNTLVGSVLVPLRVVTNPAGIGICCWPSNINGGTQGPRRVYASLYNFSPTPTWTLSNPSPLSVIPSGTGVSDGPTANFPQVAIDPTGNAFVVWQESANQTATITQVRGSFYDTTTQTWQYTGTNALFISDSNPGISGALNPNGVGGGAIQMDTLGNTYIVIRQSISTTPGAETRIYLVKYNNTNGVSAPLLLSQPGQSAERGVISMNRYGNMVVSWIRFNGSNWLVQGTYYSAITGQWSAVTNLSLPGITQSPYASISDNGDAVVVWSQTDGVTARINAAFFSAPINGTSFRGTKQFNRFATQGKYYDMLTWEASTDPNIVRYLVVQDGNILASIPVGSPLTCNIPVCRSTQTRTYFLYAITNNGVASAPTIITID